MQKTQNSKSSGIDKIFFAFYARMQDAKYSSTFSFDIFYGKTFFP